MERVGVCGLEIEQELNLREEKEILRVPDYFECRITMGLLKDPVMLSSGFTYERGAI